MNEVCEEAVSGFMGHNFWDIFHTVPNIRLIFSKFIELYTEMLGLTLRMMVSDLKNNIKFVFNDTGVLFYTMIVISQKLYTSRWNIGHTSSISL